MPTSEHTVKLRIITEDKTSGPAKAAAKGLSGITDAAKALAATLVIRKLADYAAELTKLGASAEQQGRALDNLAQSHGQSADEIVKAIKRASDFTIDSLTAMEAANRALIMGVAETPAQFERLTEIAVRLGRAMGRDAVSSINDFVTAAGRQSYLIADNLGLIMRVEEAQENYAKTLGKTVEEMTDAEKRQGFLNEMLVQGEAKLRQLGDTSIGTAEKMQQFKVSVQEAKIAIGTEFSDYLGELIDGLALLNPELADAETFWRRLGRLLIEQLDPMRDTRLAIEDNIRAKREDKEATNDQALWLAASSQVIRNQYNAAIESAEQHNENLYRAQLDEMRAAEEQADTIDHVAYVSEGYAKALHNGVQSNEQILQTILDTTEALKEQEEAAAEAREEMVRNNATFIGLAMQYTSYQQDVTDAAADFAQQRADIEADHQAKLEELAAKGSAKRVMINAAAEEEKLQDLRDNLTLAEMRYNEFTDKTAESTRLAKEMQIADLREQVATQEKLLDDHYNNRLWAKGKNVDDELAEEERHYREALAELNKAEAEQERSQRESLGRMVLAHFEAWQEMTLAVDGYTQEEVAFVTQMRLDIAKEYGLMTDAAIQEITDTERVWSAKMHLMKLGILETKEEVGRLVSRLKDLATEIANLPGEKKIKIITQYIHEGSPGANIPTITRQGGGPVRGGYPVLVGEGGPELFVPGSSGQIINNSRTEQIIGSNNIYNLTDPRQMAILSAAERAAARNRFARASGMGA